MNQEARRRFLRNGAGTLGALLVSNPLARAFSDVCNPTPDQTPGPFYPGEESFSPNSMDLTRVEGRQDQAIGQKIYIRGTVVDSACLPIAGAVVEIWQACHTGKYDHASDPNPAAIDPAFRYWGEVTTDANGSYQFLSIIPGAYPATDTWTRPPHIHFKITKLGFHDLITQMYFAGNPLNERDQILQALRRPERESVTVNFTSAPMSDGNFEPGSQIGDFRVTLRRAGQNP